MCRVVDNVLYTAHGQSQIANVVGGQGNVDVDEGHDEEGGYCEGPPAVWIIVNSKLVKEGRRKVGPEEVHY